MGIETAVAIGGLIATAASVGSTAYGMATQEKPKPPVIPPDTTANAADINADAQAAEAKKKQQQQLASQQGRPGSILTSPLGSEQEANTARPSLLGA